MAQTASSAAGKIQPPPSAYVADEKTSLISQGPQGLGVGGKRLALVGLCLTTTVASMVYSLLAPLFPDEAAAKGVSDTVIGLIFSSFACVAFVTSPFLGAAAGIVGRRRLLFMGIVLLSTTTFCFGFLCYIQHKQTFIVLCFVVRLLQGLGAAAVEVASYSTLAVIFQENLSLALGMSEATYGIGYMIGPPVAGVLFEIGGYPLAFIVTAVLSLSLLVLLSVLLPSEADMEEEDDSTDLTMKDVIRRPSILLVAGAATLSNSSCSFLEPTLGGHVAPLVSSKALVGGLFFVMSCAYALVAPGTGWASHRDRFGPKTVVIAGLSMIAAGFFILGPTPLISSLPMSLNSIIFALLIIGVGQNMAMLPVLDYLISTSDDLSYDSINVLSGIVNSSFSLGEIIGPIAGGTLVAGTGFGWASTIWAFLIAFYALVLSGFFCWEWSKFGGYIYNISVTYVTAVVNSTDIPGGIRPSDLERPRVEIPYDKAPVQISRRGRYHKVKRSGNRNGRPSIGSAGSAQPFSPTESGYQIGRHHSLEDTSI